MFPNANALLSSSQEPYRLAVLRRLLILNSTEQRVRDDMTRLLACSLEIPIHIISVLDDQCDRFKPSVGLPIRQSAEETSFCNVFFTSQEDIVVVEDTTQDARFALHPFVTGPPFLRFYAAARLIVAGHTVGTLCVRDEKPRKISMLQIQQMQTLANAVAELLNQRAVSNAAANVLSCDLRLLSAQL